MPFIGGIDDALNDTGSVPAGHLVGIEFIVRVQLFNQFDLFAGDGLVVPLVALLFIPNVLLFGVLLFEVLIYEVKNKLQRDSGFGAVFVLAQVDHAIGQRFTDAVCDIGDRQDIATVLERDPCNIVHRVTLAKCHDVHLLLFINPSIGDFVTR